MVRLEARRKRRHGTSDERCPRSQAQLSNRQQAALHHTDNSGSMGPPPRQTRSEVTHPLMSTTPPRSRPPPRPERSDDYIHLARHAPTACGVPQLNSGV
eukprot:6208165-Pleurochrysis_carterae.AAC.5